MMAAGYGDGEQTVVVTLYQATGGQQPGGYYSGGRKGAHRWLWIVMCEARIASTVVLAVIILFGSTGWPGGGGDGWRPTWGGGS